MTSSTEGGHIQQDRDLEQKRDQLRDRDLIGGSWIGSTKRANRLDEILDPIDAHSRRSREAEFSSRMLALGSPVIPQECEDGHEGRETQKKYNGSGQIVFRFDDRRSCVRFEPGGDFLQMPWGVGEKDR